jgi:hypothetical protein
MRSAKLRRDDSYLVDQYRAKGWVAFIAVEDLHPTMFRNELAEMREWCAERYGANADSQDGDWTTFDINSRWYSSHRLFLFRCMNDAIEFRLTWT